MHFFPGENLAAVKAMLLSVRIFSTCNTLDLPKASCQGESALGNDDSYFI